MTAKSNRPSENTSTGLVSIAGSSSDSNPWVGSRLVSVIGQNPKELFGRGDVRYTSDGSVVVEQTNDLPVVTAPARTTFYARDVETLWDPLKFDRLHALNEGRRHTWEENSKRKSAVRTEAMLKRCDAILQQCEVPDRIRTVALKQVHRRDLRGFSRYYQGADGACVAFSLVLLFDDVESAKESWFAQRAGEVVPGFDQGTVRKLIDYTFDKWRNN